MKTCRFGKFKRGPLSAHWILGARRNRYSLGEEWRPRVWLRLGNSFSVSVLIGSDGKRD